MRRCSSCGDPLSSLHARPRCARCDERAATAAADDATQFDGSLDASFDPTEIGDAGGEVTLTSWPPVRPPRPRAITSPGLPERIGSYRVEGLIAAGSSSRIYQAHHPTLDRPVAIKIMRRERVVDPEAHRRFHARAVALSRLTHPAIVTTFDHGHDEHGAPFLVMERVVGESLAQLLARDGALTPRLAARIARVVAEAAFVAHGQGVVHRDLGPGRILLAVRGGELQVKVTGFGVAAAEGRDADVRALGVMLFEMLIGQRSASVPPPPLRALDPRVPPALEALVGRMTTGSPPPTMAEVVAWLDGLELGPRSPGEEFAEGSAAGVAAMLAQRPRRAVWRWMRRFLRPWRPGPGAPRV